MSTDYTSMSVDELVALADKRGIDTDKIKGTGSGGNIVKADWVKALEKLDRQEAKAAAAAEEPEVVEDEAGDAPETAEVEPEVESAPEPPAISRLSYVAFGDHEIRPDVEVMAKAADLIEWFRDKYERGRHGR